MKKLQAWLIVAITASFVLLLPALSFAQTQDTAPPSVPTGVTAAKSSNQAFVINVNWSASTDNVGIAGYYVYRNGAMIGATSDTGLTDTLPIQGTYYYSVKAYDAAGNVSLMSSPT